MNIDDLRDVLNEDFPDDDLRLDGREMLQQAHRARTRRRLETAGGTALALVTIAGVTLGLLNLPALNRNEVGRTASPVVSTTAQPTPTSPAPTPTASPSTSASSSPSEAPSSTPASTSGPTVTSSTGTPRPSGGAPGALTQVCEARNDLAFATVPGLMARRGALDVTYTDNTIWATVDGTRTPLSKLASGESAMGAATDGRHVMFAGGVDIERGGSGINIYRWDSRSGGAPVRVHSGEAGGEIQVRDGWGLFTEGGEIAPRVHLVNLSTGSDTVIHVGEFGGLQLLDGGRWVVWVPSSDGGMRAKGTDPGRPIVNGKPVTMFAPVFTNGRAIVYADANAGENPNARTMLWMPGMAEPVPVFTGASEPFLGRVGTNYALIARRDRDFHLIDLRTGARVTLPAPNFSVLYTLSPDDMLIRDGIPSAGTTGTKKNAAWVDLSGRTLSC